MIDLGNDYKAGLLPSMNELYVQSDRCAYQFWGPRNFAFIAGYHEHDEGVTMQHDSTASKHGKHKSDGDGSHVKTDADRAELQRKTIKMAIA
jgi:hypothetical protein